MIKLISHNITHLKLEDDETNIIYNIPLNVLLFTNDIDYISKGDNIYSINYIMNNPSILDNLDLTFFSGVNGEGVIISKDLIIEDGKVHLGCNKDNMALAIGRSGNNIKTLLDKMMEYYGYDFKGITLDPINFKIKKLK